MHTSSSRTGRLLYACTVALLLTSISPSSLGQFNSRPASVALIARLESLSVGAAPSGDVSFAGHGDKHPVSVLVTTAWAVPSNRTTVSVLENGTPLFSQSAGESNRPGRRIDQLNIALAPDRSEGANPENQRRKVIIFVQAL